MSYKLDKNDEKELVNKLLAKKDKTWREDHDHIYEGNNPISIDFSWNDIRIGYYPKTIDLRMSSRSKLRKVYGPIFKELKKVRAKEIYNRLKKEV